MRRRLGIPLLAVLLFGTGLVGAAPGAAARTGFGFGTVTGGTNRSHARVTSVRMAQHPHYDRFVITFDGRRVPRFSVVPKSSSVFRLDPSDRRVDLLGAAGIKIVLRNTTGQGSYAGPRDFRPRFPQLREARLIGDFEAITTWGLGLSHAAAKRVLVLTGPARLVVDVHH